MSELFLRFVVVFGLLMGIGLFFTKPNKVKIYETHAKVTEIEYRILKENKDHWKRMIDHEKDPKKKELLEMEADGEMIRELIKWQLEDMEWRRLERRL